MIDQQLIDMLDDPNPQVRVNAVKQLAKSKDHEAVQYLAAIYKTDDNAEVRELARKAGLYIKKKMNEEKWTGGEGDPNAVDEVDEPADEITVSERAIETSKGHMDTALNLHMSGDDEKAATFVEKAFMTNPNLKNDSYYLGMAATILGIPGSQVADQILGDMEFSSGKAKRKRKPKPGDEAITTEKVIIDLVIYFIVIAATVIIGALILFQLLSSSFDMLQSTPEFAEFSSVESELGQEELTQILGFFLGAGLVSSIIYAFFFALFSMIGLLIQYAFYHFSATTILGGDGTFKGLIHRLTNFYTVTYAISAILGYGMLFIIFNSMFDAMAAGVEPDFESLSGMMVGISCVSMIVSIGWVFYLASLIGKNYDFGTGKGCITMIVASVLMSALGTACSFAMSATLGQMFANMLVSSGGNF